MTTTEQIILRWMPALRANPACDTARLALADELEESGCQFAEIRAAFIRKQVMSPDLKELRTIKDTLCTYHRGFISRVEGTLEQLRGGLCPFEFCVDGYWRHSGDGNSPRRTCPTCKGTGCTPGVLVDIVRLNPVEWCEVTDKQPHFSADLWWFMYEGSYPYWPEHSQIPDDLSKLAGGYSTESDAKSALSRVLIEEAIERVTKLEVIV